MSDTSETNPDIEHLDRIAHVMDSALRIPGTKLRVGLDSIIGLVPGVGDAAALLPALYIIATGYRMGAPKHVLGRMAVNTGIDTVVGAVPLLGDLFDAGFKSNRRNVAILKDHVTKKAAQDARAA